MPKAFTEQEKELINRRFLEQGYRLFSSFGLKKTNVEELANAVGISKGAFYNFYESKEALFMDVVEQAEINFRQEIMTVIEQPGPSPRARLLALFKKAFSLFEEIPILQFFTGSEFDTLFRKIPANKLEEHLSHDRIFFDEFIDRCNKTGIPIQVSAEQIISLLYPLVITELHENDLNWDVFGDSRDIYLELVAAYCLGEIDIQSGRPFSLEEKNSE